MNHNRFIVVVCIYVRRWLRLIIFFYEENPPKCTYILIWRFGWKITRKKWFFFMDILVLIMKYVNHFDLFNNSTWRSFVSDSIRMLLKLILSLTHGRWPRTNMALFSNKRTWPTIFWMLFDVRKWFAGFFSVSKA